MARDSLNMIGRRKFLTSGALGAGSGIIANSVGASSGSDSDKLNKPFNSKITIENGRAKISEISQKSRGQVNTYTAQDFVRDINKGVQKGIWQALKIGGEIKIKLTHKGRRFFERVQSKAGLDPSVRGKAYTESCNGVSKEVGDSAYIDDDVTDAVVDTLWAAGTVMQIAGILVGAIAAWTTGPFGIITGAAITAAGTLLSAGASHIGSKNEGCGVKIEGLLSVDTQECDC